MELQMKNIISLYIFSHVLNVLGNVFKIWKH